MKRKLFNLAALLSLLLCVGTVVLWVRGYSVEYTSVLKIWNSEFGLYHGKIGRYPTMLWSLDSGGWARTVVFTDRGVPIWSVSLLSAVLPVVWLFFRRPRQHGYCPTCAYNLTGNTSGVCPECGTAIVRKADA